MPFSTRQPAPLLSPLLRPLLALLVLLMVPLLPVTALADDALRASAPYTPPPAPRIASGGDQSEEGVGARAGRVSLLAGEVSWYADTMASRDWVRAEPGLRVVGRSSLSTAPGARAEVRFGSTTVSLDGDSQADFLRVAEDGLLIRVARGSVAVSVTSLTTGEPVELATATTRLAARTAGIYVLGIDRASGQSSAKAHGGQADLSIGMATLPLNAGQQALVAASLSNERRHIEPDAFDRWLSERGSRPAAPGGSQPLPQEIELPQLPQSPQLPQLPQLPQSVSSEVAPAPALMPEMSGPDTAADYVLDSPHQVPGAIWYPVVPALPLAPVMPRIDPSAGQAAHPPRRYPMPPGLHSPPGGTPANPPRTYPNPPRAYPNPPRAYPTPPRQYPTPSPASPRSSAGIPPR